MVMKLGRNYKNDCIANSLIFIPKPKITPSPRIFPYIAWKIWFLKIQLVSPNDPKMDILTLKSE